MRAGVLAAALGLLLLFGGERGGLRADLPEQSARIVHYTIEAELVPEHKLVKGTMDLVWRNPTGSPVEELYFHLYLNAFRDEESTYLREGEGDGKAGSRWDKRHAGRIDVRRMAREDGVDLWTDEWRSFVAPDDGNEKDQTLARVRLPAPVAPGETLALRVEWDARLPRVLHRTGWAGDPEEPEGLFFLVAQWFPKIAVLRENEAGEPVWNAHQFHRSTEFFSDFGVYQVALTVPESYRVGATGVRVGERTDAGDGRVRVVHRQEDVHDFAWTASPLLREAEFAWNFDEFVEQAPGEMGRRVLDLLARTAENRGREASAIKPGKDVVLRLLHPPEYAEQVERFRWAAAASLACYGIWFGAYPYDVLTVVVPPHGGRAAGGMEYPTLITVFGDRMAPSYATGMEGVTIHEFGHQFFYGLLASNEFEEAWLDEGFTSYTDARVYETVYGERAATTRYGPVHTSFFRPFEAPSLFGRISGLLRLDGWLGRLPRPWSEPDTLLPVPEASPLWSYLRDMPALHLDRMVRYAAPAGERSWWLGSGTRDAMVGPGWEFATRRDYGVNSYGKPTVFLYCLRGLMGEDAFDRALYAYAERFRFRHPTTEDALAALREQTPEEQRELLDGFVDALVESAARVDVAILDAEQREVGTGEGARWQWTIRVQRRGDVPLPVEIVAEDENGAVSVLETWISRGRETTRTVRVTRDARLRAVRLGPDWIACVDSDLSNNARLAGDGDLRPAAAFAGRWTFFVEDIVRSYAGMAR